MFSCVSIIELAYIYKNTKITLHVFMVNIAQNALHFHFME